MPLNFEADVWVMPGGLYDPVTKTWERVEITGLPDVRPYFAAWNGKAIFVAGSFFSSFAGFAYDSQARRWAQVLSGTTGSFQGRQGTWAPELREVLVFGGMWVGSSASWSGGTYGARGFRLQQ